MSSDSSDAARLTQQLIHAHRHNSRPAETAAVDQIQAFLETSRQARARDIICRCVRIAAATMRGMATAAGKSALVGKPAVVWQLTRGMYAHREDPVACELVLSALEAELNEPGSAHHVVETLLGSDARECLAVVREAAWQAATVGTRCVII